MELLSFGKYWKMGKLLKTDGNGDQYDMIHTENFMLIDKKRQIRGFYDGTLSEDIDRLLEDIETLKYFGGS